MDLKQTMVLIHQEDKTLELESVQYDELQKQFVIRYLNGKKPYFYKENNVEILEKPEVLDLNGQVAYVDHMPVFAPECILDFGKKLRIFQYNGVPRTVDKSSFTFLDSGAKCGAARHILEYLEDIATYTNDNSEEDAYLKKEMEQLKFVHPQSVLGCYLSKSPIEKRTADLEQTIFPFRFNLSQKTALEQALTHSISVIEGPPGTGKTHTILNILANLVTIQGKSVAVVSGNNEAVKNVIQKLEEKHYGFLTALLGRTKNQDDFFAHPAAPDVEGWDCKETEEELFAAIQGWNNKIAKLMHQERKKAQLEQELRTWQLEEEHFDTYLHGQDVSAIMKLPLFCRTPAKIMEFLAETSVAIEYEQNKKVFYKLKMLIKYGVINTKKIDKQECDLLLSIQKTFYQLQIQRLKRQIEDLEEELESESFDTLTGRHQEYSERLFRKLLYKRYSGKAMPGFTKKNYKIQFEKFIAAYPIILSTTHALLRSIPQNYLLDYVIIDEASQVDLITGVLALSCCKNVIIVGDLKQLHQIANEKIRDKLITQPPSEEYDYFKQSILSSITALYGKNLPSSMLREHYRCHPQIIEFCNQKYYGGQLIMYNKPPADSCPLVIYKTSEGNHMRRVTRGEQKGVYNQREIDVIIEEILQGQDVSERLETVGVITPYRKQANMAAKLLDARIESDTVHKYQGREKETIIMSTVLDEAKSNKWNLSFVDDPLMVNVAVSRAVQQFILVTDHELFFKHGDNIQDLIRYMQYSTLDDNLVESQVISIFDLLYKRYSERLRPIKEKMLSTARYQSEEAQRVLLEEILSQPEFSRFCFTQGVLLQNLLRDTSLLTKEELAFIRHRASLDFVIFYRQDKSCALVIEVDGFEFHENNPKQRLRDEMKDRILEKYKVPYLRLATNGSGEKRKIESVLLDLKY